MTVFLGPVVCANVNVPVRITTRSRPCGGIGFIGMKANRTVNTGRVWVMNANVAGGPGIPVLPGLITGLSGDQLFNADEYWIQAENAGDGVIAVLT